MKEGRLYCIVERGEGVIVALAEDEDDVGVGAGAAGIGVEAFVIGGRSTGDALIEGREHCGM